MNKKQQMLAASDMVELSVSASLQKEGIISQLSALPDGCLDLAFDILRSFDPEDVDSCLKAVARFCAEANPLIMLDCTLHFIRLAKIREQELKHGVKTEVEVIGADQFIQKLLSAAQKKQQTDKTDKQVATLEELILQFRESGGEPDCN